MSCLLSVSVSCIAFSKKTGHSVGMYTHEIRHRAIVHYTYFAREYGVGKSTLCRWLSKRLGHPCCKKDANGMKTFIGEIVSQNPFTTASGIVETLSSRHDIETSKSSVYRTLRSKGFTFKKSQRTKVRSDLDIHHNSMNTLYGEDTISVDESHFNAADCIRYGWGIKGERVHETSQKRRYWHYIVLEVS